MSKSLKIGLSSALILILGACAFYFGYWTKTPQYSLALIGKAVQAHDVATFEQHVDTDQLFSKLFDDCFTLQLGSQPSDNPYLTGILKGLKQLVVPVFSAQAKSYVQTGKLAQELHLEGDSLGRGSQLAAGMTAQLGLLHLQYKKTAAVTTSGDTAQATFTLHDERLDQDLPLTIKLVRLPDRTWKITEITNVKEFLEARKQGIKKKLATLNQPTQDKIAATLKVAKSPVLAFRPSEEGQGLTALQAVFALNNLSDKDILSVSGNFSVMDQEDKPLFTTSFEAGSLPAGATNSTTNSWTLNPYNPGQKSLSQLQPAQIKGQLEITSVLFKDGSSLTLQDRLPRA